MVITEEELREAWQNGRGRIPEYPPGTRFTPAAQDFLKNHGPAVLKAAVPPPAAAAQASDGGRRELRAPAGQRVIYTAAEVPELLAGHPGTLVVHPSVTLTHAALERLRGAGVRVVPFLERTAAPEPPAPAPAAPRSAAPVQAAPESDLYRQVRTEVLARLGGSVDPNLLDAVLRRVLAAL